jgi:hypothetical protein
MSSSRPPQSTPLPAPPPTPVDPMALEARDRTKQLARAGAGRKGTVLTGQQGAAGAPSLGGSTLLGGGKPGPGY